MKNLDNFRDLAPYGINPLTGEACAYSMRILCDLSEQGAELVASFLGIPYRSTCFNPNWNSMVGSEPARFSIMLSRSSIRELMLYALLSVDRCTLVIESKNGGFVGLSAFDDYYDNYMREITERPDQYIVHRHPPSFQPSAGGRNTHAMTGRTV